MRRGLKTLIFMFLDFVIISLAWIIPILLLDYSLDQCIEHNYLYFIGSVVITLVFHLAIGLNRALLKYASVSEALKIILSSAIMFVYTLIVAFLSEEFRAEWSILVTLIFFCTVGGVRFLYRLNNFLSEEKHRHIIQQGDCERVLIIGAGSVGMTIISDLKKSADSKMEPVCVLDDNPTKLGCMINGVKIVGTIDNVKKACKEYAIDKIIIAIPSLDKKALMKIVEKCEQTKCKVLTMPSVHQIADGSVSINDIKEVSTADLLGREQVKVNLDEIMKYIEGKTILVTGGGGSIGSELCRQIALHKPKHLIILDIYENNAYDIEQELLRRVPNINLTTLIASVRDAGKIDKVFKEYKPQIVFHAAAHKHVPLMETSPNEAVKNNVYGTYNVADTAGRYGVEKFVLISSDKAVNPTNIMGATKRICEMIIQTINKRYANTDYVAVRFGNVLGSNGSVIPLFKKQIQDGGPILVTHKDIIRYFMTIPEAVTLVLQAGAYAKGGEIFVLDMGEPVRIYDLAVNMIKLSGLEPYKDIDIKITGLRPGEKLYEEMLMDEEGMGKTANDLIYIGKPLDLNEETLFEDIEQLRKAAYEETDDMKDIVSKLVPTYKKDQTK